MNRLASSAILVFIILAALACSSGEESSTDAQSSPSPAPAVSRTSSTPSLTPASPTPIETPPAESTEASPIPSEPDENLETLVGQIYESLPRPLPKNATWEIRWTGDPAVGLFQIWAIDPATNSDFQEAMEAAQDWFREHGHEPCRYPLAGLIGYTSNGAYPPEPTDAPWEPCR